MEWDTNKSKGTTKRPMSPIKTSSDTGHVRANSQHGFFRNTPESPDINGNQQRQQVGLYRPLDDIDKAARRIISPDDTTARKVRKCTTIRSPTPPLIQHDASTALNGATNVGDLLTHSGWEDRDTRPTDSSDAVLRALHHEGIIREFHCDFHSEYPMSKPPARLPRIGGKKPEKTSLFPNIPESQLRIRERVERDNCNIQKKVDKDYARKEEQLKNVIPPSGWKDTPKATGEEDHVQYARGPLHVERHRHVERNKHRTRENEKHIHRKEKRKKAKNQTKEVDHDCQ